MASPHRPADADGEQQPLLRDWHEDGSGGEGEHAHDAGEEDAPAPRSVRVLIRMPNRYSWLFLSRCTSLVLIDVGALGYAIESFKYTLVYRSNAAWLALAFGLVSFVLYCIQPYLRTLWRRVCTPILVALDFTVLSLLVSAMALVFTDIGYFYYRPHPTLITAGVFDGLACFLQAIILVDSFAHLITSLKSRPGHDTEAAAAQAQSAQAEGTGTQGQTTQES